jgi:hypothetical protein
LKINTLYPSLLEGKELCDITFQILNTHGLQEYDDCYKEKCCTIKLFSPKEQESRLNTQKRKEEIKLIVMKHH